MTDTRRLHLGAFMRPVSIHTGAWRYPGAYADANFNFAHIKRFAQKLEAGKFDAFFNLFDCDALSKGSAHNILKFG